MCASLGKGRQCVRGTQSHTYPTSTTKEYYVGQGQECKSFQIHPFFLKSCTPWFVCESKVRQARLTTLELLE